MRDVFEKRSRIVRAIRNFLDARGFIEVETPTLQPLYGGAAARPFTTEHHALSQTFYLRIAVELYLKRLIVGGFDRVYEITKNAGMRASTGTTLPNSPCWSGMRPTRTTKRSCSGPKISCGR